MALFVSVFGSRGIFVMLCVEVVCCVRVTDRCGCCICVVCHGIGCVCWWLVVCFSRVVLSLSLCVCVCGVVLLCPPSPLWLFDVLFVPPSFVLSMFVHCGVCVPLLHPPPCVFVAVVVVVRCFH